MLLFSMNRKVYVGVNSMIRWRKSIGMEKKTNAHYFYFNLNQNHVEKKRIMFLKMQKEKSKQTQVERMKAMENIYEWIVNRDVRSMHVIAILKYHSQRKQTHHIKTKHVTNFPFKHFYSISFTLATFFFSFNPHDPQCSTTKLRRWYTE